MTTLPISKQVKSSVRRAAIAAGWRSGFEMQTAAYLEERGISFEFENHKLSYVVPSRAAKYTPDFYVTTRSGKIIICETKGQFATADRQKMILVKQQHPDLDIRMVFSNWNSRISPKSKTTYKMWCEKHGYPCAHQTIPEVWLNE